MKRISCIFITVISLFGCVSERDQPVVGAWTVDASKIDFSEMLKTGMSRRLKRNYSQFVLKVRYDHTFLFATQKPIEGKWVFKNKVLSLIGKDRTVQLTLTKQNELVFDEQTPLGNAKVVFKKSS